MNKGSRNQSDRNGGSGRPRLFRRAMIAVSTGTVAALALATTPAQAAPTITWDTPQSYTPTAQYYKYYTGTALSRDGSTAFRYWTAGNYSSFNVAVTDMSGATPVYGAASEPAPLAIGSNFADQSFAAISSDGKTVVVAQTYQQGASPYDYILRIVSGSISGTTITWGSATTVNQHDYNSNPRFQVALDGSGTKGVLLTADVGSTLKAREFTVAGNAVTMGNVAELDADIGSNGEADIAITPDGDKAVARWSKEGSPWQMKAAKATRVGGNLSWTNLDNLAVPNGYSWNNNSDRVGNKQLSLSDDGTRAAVVVAPVGSQTRVGLWGLNTEASSGSQWTDVSWVAPPPGEINMYVWSGDISEDGTTLIAAGPGAYVRSHKYDGSTLTGGTQLEVTAPASEWPGEQFPWISMDGAGTAALLAFTASTTQGVSLPIDIDPATATLAQDNSQIESYSTPNQSEFISAVASDWNSQVLSWVIGAAGTPYIRVGTSRSAPVFVDETPPTSGTVDTPYQEYTFKATGSLTPTYEVSSGSLPPGLTLDGTTGKLSGTPTTPGTYTFKVRAVNGVGTDETADITITIAGGSEPATAPVFVDKTPPTTGTKGKQYPGYKFVATGSPAPTYEVASGSLPPGLTLDKTTGQLTGTPTKAGTYTFKVVATNSAGSTETADITITITEPANKRAPQKPSNSNGKAPAKVKQSGVTVITGAGARTNAGQRIRTQVRCTPGPAAAGEKRYCSVIRGANGKVSVRTYGLSQVRIVVVQSAPATDEYRAYRKRTVYVNGKKQ